MQLKESVEAHSTVTALQSSQAELIFPCVRPLYKNPIALREARGVWVTDVEGNDYLDLFAGILSTSLGHCHPEVIDRVHAQSKQLGHTSTLYISEPQLKAAQRLADIAPGNLKTSMFLNSGSAAIDAAITLAKAYTGRDEIIALRHGYSGNSVMAAHLTGHAAWRPATTSVAGIKHALAPYPYRSPFGDDPELNATQFARDIENVILTTTSGKPAALLAETIQGVGGFIVPPPGYFQLAAEIIRSYGGVFICDEVQTGFGRTGKHWFGIQHWDVEPDIMVMAKGIANGYPVGALITRPEIAASWTRKTISTFGGNPISMAAVDATLDIMTRERAPERAEKQGRQLRNGLEQLSRTFSWMGEIRGLGLMQAIEIVTDRTTKTPDPERTQALLEAAKNTGLLLGLGGLYGNAIRIGPSLLIESSEVDEALKRLEKACYAVT